MEDQNQDSNEIFQPILDEFKVQIGENEDKNLFIGGLIRIFMILLSAKARAPTKIKKIIKESVNLVLKLWPELKQQSQE